MTPPTKRPVYPLGERAILRAVKLLWPRRHVKTLGEHLNRSRNTAASWLYGKRSTPQFVTRDIAAVLRQHAAMMLAVADELDRELVKRELTLPKRSGFCVVKERDGPGSIPRRGGRGLR